MSSHVTVWSGAALGLALFLNGCNSPTAPASLNDPVTTAANAAALDSAFGSSVVASFQSLGSSIKPAPPVGAAVRALRVVRVQPGAGRYAALATEGHALQQLVPGFASLNATGIFPPSVLGSVFVWDAGTKAYVVGSTGGPSNGVRFLLYAIDPLTTLPATPLTQVGYVDLMDESVGGTARLHIQVKNTDASITYLDYLFSGSGSSASFNASVSGTITNGLGGAANKTLAFDVTIAGNPSAVMLTSSYVLNNPSVTVHETLTIADDGTTTTLTINFTFSRTGETINISGTVAVSDADGSGTVNIAFTVNGRPFASIMGSTSNATITRAGGGPLTADERNAIVRLFEAAADIGKKVGEIFAPAKNILGF